MYPINYNAPMAKKIPIASLRGGELAAHLTTVLQDNHGAQIAAALGELARARGMGEIAKASGITREALYKALRADASPRFDTVVRVCAALGVKIVAQPIASST